MERLREPALSTYGLFGPYCPAYITLYALRGFPPDPEMW